MKQKIEVEVSKEAHELGQALVGVVKAAKESLADGFQVTDLAVISAKSFAQVVEGVKGIDQLGAESKEDLDAFMKSWMLAGADIAAVFLKKAPAQSEPLAVEPEAELAKPE